MPYRQIMKDMSSIGIITKAAEFAAHSHRNQRRKNIEKSPYIIHPLRVGNLLSNVGKVYDAEVIAAAYLHDVVEDTPVTLEEIIREFGETIANTVKEVSDDKSLSKVERKKLQVKNAPHKSKAAKLVKLADKLDNLSDHINELCNGFTEETRRGYFVWAFFIVDSMRGTNKFLEEELDKLFVKILSNDGVTLPTKENLQQDLDKYYSLLAPKESVTLVIQQEFEHVPLIDVDPICETEMSKMHERHDKELEFGAKLQSEGHTCVYYLESYPAQAVWCEKTPCKNNS